MAANSSLYSTNFLDTINGYVTIRAFGWLPNQIARSNELLDMSQRPSYLLAMVQQWLTLTMNIVVTFIAVLLVSLATLRVNSGFVGAGMVTLITFGASLASIISSYTGLEISLGGITRLKTFSEITETEDMVGEDIVPGEEWPSTG